MLLDVLKFEVAVRVEDDSCKVSVHHAYSMLLYTIPENACYIYYSPGIYNAMHVSLSLSNASNSVLNYLACQVLREAVTLHDMRNWVMSLELPYFSFFKSTSLSEAGKTELLMALVAIP